jgi:hypothetical protein
MYKITLIFFIFIIKYLNFLLLLFHYICLKFIFFSPQHIIFLLSPTLPTLYQPYFFKYKTIFSNNIKLHHLLFILILFFSLILFTFLYHPFHFLIKVKHQDVLFYSNIYLQKNNHTYDLQININLKYITLYI